MDSTDIQSTVPGASWGKILEVNQDNSMAAETQLRQFIKKRGRKTIKAKGEKIWVANKIDIIGNKISAITFQAFTDAICQFPIMSNKNSLGPKRELFQNKLSTACRQ
ncbi:MAG: hypothetical protein HY231_19430 [Acidobacteria bacterium]|nr:hypothetical protein [Acidobacteriota bacterium]